MTVESFWTQVNESALRQGDYLPGCLVPAFGPALDTGTAATLHEVMAGEFDLILVTQSCDLEQRKVRLVAACPIYPLTEFEAANPAFAKNVRPVFHARRPSVNHSTFPLTEPAQTAYHESEAKRSAWRIKNTRKLFAGTGSDPKGRPIPSKQGRSKRWMT